MEYKQAFSTMLNPLILTGNYALRRNPLKTDTITDVYTESLIGDR
jgi:hypothetical protein